MRKCRYTYEDGREKRTRSSCESCEFRAIRNKVAVIVSSWRKISKMISYNF